MSRTRRAQNISRTFLLHPSPLLTREDGITVVLSVLCVTSKRKVVPNMAETLRIRSGNAGRGNPRSISARRWGTLIGGSALAIYGITRRSPLGVALAAGGGTLAVLGAKRQSSEDQSSSAWTTLLVNCKPEEVYRFWRDFENFPRFMNRLETVTVLDNRRSRWVAVGPMGRPIHWDAEITSERENEFISWRSLPGSDIEADGRVEFSQAPAGRGTLIGARLEFRPVAGTSLAISKFLNKGANFAMRQDMRRLEALMEAGELPTVEGQSHGPRDLVTGILRLADPTRPTPYGTKLKHAFEARRSIA
jgi:Predicted integral membrane protein